jgi:hypothetical protein
MAAAPSTQLTTPHVSVDEGQAPPEIVRFHRSGVTGDYYQALGAAAQMRLRLLGTLHARSELRPVTAGDSARKRLAAQQNLAWQQLQWLVAEMRRIDDGATGRKPAQR